MKNKGFTLVELLAVMVILGVISLIVVPIISDVISDSRQASFKSSLTGIKKAIETDYSDNGFDTSKKYYYGGTENGNYDGASTKILIARKVDGSDEKIAISGEINGKGKGSVNPDGSVNVGILTDDYCGLVEGNDVRISEINETFTKEDCIHQIDLIEDK